MGWSYAILVASLALGITAAACGLAQSRAIAASVEGMARQPEASGDISRALLLGLAFIESLTLYMLVFAILVWITARAVGAGG